MAIAGLLNLRLIGAITLVLRGRWSTGPHPDSTDLLAALERSPYPGIQVPGYFGNASFESEVLRHLVYMEAMGVVVRVDRHGGWPVSYGNCWRVSRQDELRDHLAHNGDTSGSTRDEDIAPVDTLETPANGGRGDGGDGGGDVVSNGDGNGNGSGIREVLAHPVLFALPRNDFRVLVDELFAEGGGL